MKNPTRTVNLTNPTSSRILDELNGFKILPLIIAENLTHFLYFKKHNGEKKSSLIGQQEEEETFRPNHTLFVINLPLGASEATLKELFEREGCGLVRKVTFKKIFYPVETTSNEHEVIEEDEEREEEQGSDSS